MLIESSQTNVKNLIERLLNPPIDLARQKQRHYARLLPLLALAFLLVIPIVAPLWIISRQNLAVLDFMLPVVLLAVTGAYLVSFLPLVALGAVGAVQMKRYKQQVADSDVGYHSVVAVMTEGVILYTRSGVIQSCNAAAERILGLTDAQMIGRTAVDPRWRAIREDGSPFSDEDHPVMVTLRTGRPFTNVIMGVQQPAGALRWISLQSHPLVRAEESLPYAVATSFTDFTESLQREQALREAQHRYYALFEQAHDAVFILDLEGRHLEANHRAAEMLGYTAPEIQRLSFKDLSAEVEESQDIRQRLLAGAHIPVYERMFRKKDGRLIPVEVKVELVRDLAGNPLHIQSVVRDITGHKQAEAALREQHAELDRFFTLALDLLCIANVDGRFLKVNKAWEDILGYSANDLQGQAFLDFVHPDDLQFTLEALTMLDAQKPILNFINRFRTKQGEYRYIEWRSVSVDKLIYAAARDITKRQQTEEALRQSEARQRAMLTAIPDLIFRNHTDGTFLDYHAPNPNMLFMPPEVFMGKKIAETLPAKAAQEQMALIQRVAESGQMAMHEFEAPHHGENRRFEVRIVPVGDNEVLSIARDVTELWQTRHELERAQARLEFAVDTARLAWWEMDVATGSMQFDKRKVLMAGYDPQDFVDVTYHTFAKLVHPEDYAAMMQAMLDLIEGRQALYTADYRMRTAYGGWIWFHEQGELLTIAGGRRVVRGFGMDITEQKRGQQREIALALEKERVDMLSTFIQNASHEFKTPLAIINNSAFVMAQMTEAEQRRHKVTIIQEQVKRMAKLLDMLLVMTKLESSTPTGQTLVDMSALLDTICQEPFTQDRHRPAFHCESSHNLPCVMGNPDELLEAIKQILSNAYRFTPADGVVTMTSGATSDHIWLEVRDTGPGISPEHLPYIFETFWRQDEAHSTPGFGLGLSIVRRVIEKHGGRINVESKVGVGSAFNLILPIHSPAATLPGELAW